MSEGGSKQISVTSVAFAVGYVCARRAVREIRVRISTLFPVARIVYVGIL